MPNIIIVEKNGDLKNMKFNPEKDELYKKCKFKNDNNFEHRHTWTTKNNKYSFTTVSLYARNVGKANTENKYDFPPPVDTILFFGSCVLVAKSNEDNYVDLSLDEWNKCYEDLFGGFENLDDTAKQDEEEIDELENIPDEMKTKSGYLKDDFVVDDNMIEDENSDYSTLELEFEDYDYSDEEDQV